MIKFTKSTIVFLSLVFFMAVAVFSGNLIVKAATSSKGPTITTTPIASVVHVAPGSTGTTSMQVQNDTLSPIGITVKLAQFKAHGNKGQAQIVYPSANDPTMSWVSVSQDHFIAQPATWTPVTMTINLPKTAGLGYYYSALFIPDVAATKSKSENTIKSANAVFVLVDTNSKNEKNLLSLSKFSVNKSVYQFLPVTFSVDITNSGNIFNVPRGDIFISRSPSGPAIDTIDINKGDGSVLPGTDRIFNVDWGDGFPSFVPKKVNGSIVSDKNGNPAMDLKWDLTKITKFRFGKYYARIVVIYNNGTTDVPVQSTIGFWVIPWWILVGLTIIFAFILAGIVSLLKPIYRHFVPNTVNKPKKPKKQKPGKRIEIQ